VKIQGTSQDASGLKLLGHRYYDSSTGRFQTRDPIKDGRNWYVYCDSESVTRVDYSGYRSIFIGGGAQAVFGIFSVSLHIDLVFDLDNGKLGINPNIGIDGGLGLYGGIGLEAGYDDSGVVKPGPTKGYATGILTPPIGFELYDDDGDLTNGGSTGGGGARGPGQGFGLYNEARIGEMFEIFDFY
jgi:RHS repeat-associated protein